MSQINADRNLLLGILAYQNAFVTRDALFAGMQAWLYDKTKSLADILQNQGALDAERRLLLEAMVQHHLKQHGGDPQRSLQAVSSASSVRGDLEKMPDPDLQASLVHLSKAKDDDDPFRTRTLVGTPTSAGTRFRRLRPHAKGGLGEVFVALDSELNREVALKEIQDRHADEPESRARFLQEAEITGGLEHPGIVPVYGLGTYADGRPFYAMRFIRGDSLMEAIAEYHKPHCPPPKPQGESSNPASDDAASDKNLQLHKLVRRLIDVCNALQYAHDRGVLHRDLKPGNIMLGKYGETLVVDWGLAKASGEPGEPGPSGTGAGESPLRPASGGTAETMPGSAIGTPAFMSPEQAAGRLDLLGPASDIYSLGATLYCLLTGKPPLKGDLAEVLKKAQAGDFPRPRQIDPIIESPLEAVCLKAMALRPRDRYATPQQLAEDLEHWLANEPVQAWPEPWTRKARRWTSRHRVLVSSAGACLGVATVAFFAVIVLMAQKNADLEMANQTIKNKELETRQANAALQKANEETTIANKHLLKANEDETKARDHAEDLLATTTMMLAKSRFEEGQVWSAEDLLAKVPEKFRFSGWRLLGNYLKGSLFTLRGHTSGVRCVAFSADGRLAASASDDKTVKLWDARTGQEIRTLYGHMGEVTSVAFAANGHVLASAGGIYDKTVKLWDVRSGRELGTLKHPGAVMSVAFAPDGQVVASAGGALDHSVKLWDVRTGDQLHTLHGHDGAVNSVAFAPDGKVLASASADMTVNLWDVQTGNKLHTLHGHTKSVNSVAFAPDGQSLASASGDGTVRLWHATSAKQLRSLRQTEWLTSVAFAPDGELLASASVDHTVRLWDVRTGRELRTLLGHQTEVASVAFVGDGQMLGSASFDKTVKLWQARTGQELRTMRGHTSEVTSVAFGPDGQMLASADFNTVKLWDARTGKELRALRVHASSFSSVAFSADGQVLASASKYEAVKLWDTRTGEEIRTLRGHKSYVNTVAFAVDGHMLASGSDDTTVKIWDARTGEAIHTLTGHAEGITKVAFAPKRRLIVSASADKTIKLWDAQTGKELRTLRGHAQAVTSVAFSADGQVLASASWDKTVKVWDMRTGEEVRTLAVSGAVSCVAFSPDGQVLAAASIDKTVTLWDTRSGQALRTLRGHTNEVTSVAFSADGQMLASASIDKTVKLWDTRTGEDVRTLRAHSSFAASVAFAADGRVLASAGHDNMVKLWDTQTGQERRILRGHTAVVMSVTFAADGRMLASASNDKTVKVWDTGTGEQLWGLDGHTDGVTCVAFGPVGYVIASGSHDRTVKLWNTRTGAESHTLRGHTDGITSVAFASDGKALWSRDRSGKVLAWDPVTGKQLLETSGTDFGPNAPGVWSVNGPGAWSASGGVFALGEANGHVLLVRKAISETERWFRLWVTAPDLHLHRELAEQADKDKQPLALAFRLGRYLAATNYYAAEPKQAATLAGWLGTAAQPPGLLPGLPALVKTPFHEPTFTDGVACTGVLYKDSGIAPERLLIGTSRALAGDPTNWLNHAFHGGALFRNGEHARAVAELNEAVKLHGKPSSLTHCFLALTYLQMGEKAKARNALAQAPPPKDAPWEEVLLHRLFEPEIDAALAKADGNQDFKEK